MTNTMRRFAVGDIHGCSKTLRKMIEEVLQLKKADILFLLGDYIDRGPDSKGVLDYLLELRADGYDIRPLRGNHEDMMLQSTIEANIEIRKTWYGNGGWGALREFGVEYPDEIPARYLEFISGLPYSLTTDDYVFVHAGFDFETDNPIQDTPQQFMIWSRGGIVDTVKLGGRTLVTGHTVTALFEIKASLDTDHIKLDNGCWNKDELSCGALVALDLDKRELLVQVNVETPTLPQMISSFDPDRHGGEVLSTGYILMTEPQNWPDHLYKQALKRLEQDKVVIARQREILEALGSLTPEEIDRVMQPLLSFHAGLIEEVELYEKER